MQDTFFISKDPDMVLRTHTSNVQIRLMEKEKPPMRVVIPGRVYRNETVSAKSHCFFHQVEGLYVDKDVSFKRLKKTLYITLLEKCLEKRQKSDLDLHTFHLQNLVLRWIYPGKTDG